LLTPRLFDLLNVEPSSADAIEAIAANLVLVSEVAKALPDLQRAATEPARADGVMAVIGRRFALFPQPKRSKAEWSEFWADYVDTLGHLPEGAIEAAMAAWVRQPDAEFLPKPGRLLELSRTTPNRAVRALERAKGALEFKAPRKVESPYSITPPAMGPRPEPSQDDKDIVRRMCRQFTAQDDERRAATASRARGGDLPNTAGPADEKGLTPQMRQLLAKQRPTPKPFEGSYE
jgi:hypothetical protein